MTALLTCALAIAWSLPFPGGQSGRDVPAPAASTGTALISGTVVSTEVPASPVRLARVTLNPVDRGGVAATATTDAAGRFAFPDLPPGRYTLQASKRAWLDANYGAARLGRPGTPVAVTAGQQVTGLKISIARGAVITGTVRDPHGDAQVGVTVRILQFVMKNGERRLVQPPGSASRVTDDDGGYRVYGLPPGDFVVMAALGAGQSSGSEIETRQIAAGEVSRALSGAGSLTSASRPASPSMVGNAPVFYPGTTELSGATTISLAAGEERSGIDVPFALYPTSRIFGAVAGFIPDSGRSMTALRLTPGGGEQLTDQPLASSVTRVGQDGKYVFAAVPPGHYTLMCIAAEVPGPADAPAGPSAGHAGPTLRGWTRVDIVADGHDLEVNLTLGQAATLTGRVVFEGGPPPKDGGGLQVVVRALGEGTLLAPEQSVRPGPDGTFSLPSLIPSQYMISSSGPRENPWALKSAIVRGQDAADQPFEVQAGETEVVVTFTDRPSALTGSLQDATGRPVSEYFVIVFPADRSAWLPTSRRIQSVRPGSDGAFSLVNLPAGDYLLNALTDVEPGEWFSASFLEQLAASAVKVRLVDGEKTVVPTLKIGGGR